MSAQRRWLAGKSVQPRPTSEPQTERCLDPLALRDAVILAGTGQRRGAGLALDLTAFLLRQRAEVAPGEGQGGAPGQEVVPVFPQFPAEHLPRPELD